MFKFFSLIFFTLTIILLFLFFNLGNILDISQKPIKSDVIVCLGGGKKNDRIKKAIELYNKNYSNKKLLILTGDNRSKKRKEKGLQDRRIEYLKENHFGNININIIQNIKSTKEEILFIKKFLLEKNYKSAIIVSDAPHTRRIQALINFLHLENDKKLKFNLVASNNNWWKRNTYYTNKKAQVFVLYETLKVGYTYVAYGFFEKLGILNSIENNPFIESIRKKIDKKTYFYLKEK